MAFSFVNDSATIGATEYSLPNDSTVLTPQTDESVLETWLDFSTLLHGDEYVWRVYEKINGAGATQRMIAAGAVAGPQLHPIITPAMILKHGWDVTVQKLSGTDRSVGWSLRKTTGGITVIDDAATIGTTEYSLPNDSTVLTPQTDDSLLMAMVDFGNLAAADDYFWRFKEKVNGAAATQRVCRSGIMNGTKSHRPLILPFALVGEGWDLTVQKLAGTDRSIGWSLRKVA